MENRERDRVSQRTSPTDAGRINREVSEERGREQNSGTGAEFGQSIGRAENLEGGEMRNKDNENNSNRNVGMGNEQSRNSGSSGLGSSSGRSSGRDSENESSSNISRNDKSPGRGGSGTLGSTGTSEGRH
ncbi:MAG TPA: hypothetical protein VGD79_01555 [Thermoanaerobaculia bacterium]|jgi:hypothetical protein